MHELANIGFFNSICCHNSPNNPKTHKSVFVTNAGVFTPIKRFLDSVFGSKKKDLGSVYDQFKTISSDMDKCIADMTRAACEGNLYVSQKKYNNLAKKYNDLSESFSRSFSELSEFVPDIKALSLSAFPSAKELKQAIDDAVAKHRSNNANDVITG